MTSSGDYLAADIAPDPTARQEAVETSLCPVMTDTNPGEPGGFRYPWSALDAHGLLETVRGAVEALEAGVDLTPNARAALGTCIKCVDAEVGEGDELRDELTDLRQRLSVV